MKRTFCFSLVTLALGVTGQAAPGDFEAPTFSPGLFGPAGPNGGPAAFNQAGGWTESASNGRGAITNTASSGSYTGGQAMGSGTILHGFNATYIGANNSLSWEQTTISFDLQQNVTDRIFLGTWADGANGGLADGKFANAEGGFTAGTIANGQFGFRGANFGTEFGSGVLPTLGNWYRVTVAYDDANFIGTMSVFNLTLQTSVDLNGAAEGTDFSHTFVAGFGANGYGVLASQADAPWIRLSGKNGQDNYIDNIVVPEPSSLALTLLGGACLLAVQHRRRN